MCDCAQAAKAKWVMSSARSIWLIKLTRFHVLPLRHQTLGVYHQGSLCKDAQKLSIRLLFCDQILPNYQFNTQLFLT